MLDSYRLIGKHMNICIGGELNGQVVEKSPNDYFQQSIVICKKTYKFWFSDKVSFHDAFVEAEKLARQV
jgi:hypothetical protein